MSIENARIEIEELLELEPGLKPSLPDVLKELFGKAKRSAEKDMSSKTSLSVLSWQEVFDDAYNL